MTLPWSYPDPDCPPTDVRPVDVTTTDDEVGTCVCGECSGTYPSRAFTRVRA